MNLSLFVAAVREHPLLGVLTLAMACVVLVGWLAGGGYLLARAHRKVVGQRHMNWPRGTLAMLLTGGAGALGAMVFYKLVSTIGDAAGSNLKYVAIVLAASIAALIAFLVLYAFYQLPFWRVVKMGWMPLAAVVALAVVSAAAVGLPARHAAIERIAMDKSIGQLRLIDEAVRQYEKTLNGEPPASLLALTEETAVGTRKAKFLLEQFLQCPRDRNLAVGYFYLPSPSVADRRSEKLRACEFTHDQIDIGRVVLYDNGEVRSVPEMEFQRLLTLKTNSQFADKFRQADRKK